MDFPFRLQLNRRVDLRFVSRKLRRKPDRAVTIVTPDASVESERPIALQRHVCGILWSPIVRKKEVRVVVLTTFWTEFNRRRTTNTLITPRPNGFGASSARGIFAACARRIGTTAAHRVAARSTTTGQGATAGLDAAAAVLHATCSRGRASIPGDFHRLALF